MAFKQRIYFYLYPEIVPDRYGGNIPYQHSVVCFAEGLKELGVEFYANTDYWKLSPEKEEYLFKHDPGIGPDDCSLVVLNDRWYNGSMGANNGYSTPPGLFKKDRNYLTMYLDHDDHRGMCKLYAYPEFKNYDLIFKTHYNSKIKYPYNNIYPTAFGLSNRIIRETSQIGDFTERKNRLLVNFRERHSSRHIIAKKFLPLIDPIIPVDHSTDKKGDFPQDPYGYLQWKQTGKRHYPGYYQRLKESLACACFGGHFISPFPADIRSETSKILALMNRFLCINTGIISQYDSWRFWESLASGCVTFHFDYEKYGFTLPIMPVNREHYIGVDLDNVDDNVSRLKRGDLDLEKISENGRKWAIKYYSPKPTAERILKIVESKL